MKRRGIRLTLVLLLVVVSAAAGYTLYEGDQRGSAMRGATRDFDAAAQRAQSQLSEARAAMLSVLAPGQADDLWLPRAAAAINGARADLNTLKQRSSDGGVLNDLDAAAAALDQVDEVRTEMERMLRNDLRLQASAVALGRGAEAFAAATERVEGARLSEVSRADAEIAAIRVDQMLASAAILALALIVAGLLLPNAAAEAPVAEPTLHDLTHAVPARVEPAAAPREPERSAAPAPPATAPAPPPAVEPVAAATQAATVDRRKAPELRAAADLCTDFARLVDAKEMPALLDRAAKLLDATGFIVWMADADGQNLRPVLAHGYPPQALARVPAIPRHADNATAAAFRHAEMQIVRTNGMSPGAIVVPVLGPTGCIGAIAAEVRHGREASESLRALARIVSAQMATLLGSAAEAAGSGSGQSAEVEAAARQAG